MKRDLLFAKEMGKRIARRRKELGLTQEKAAERCGLSLQFFASVETGGKNVRAESLAKLAEGLEVSADQLLLGRVTDFDLARDLQCLKRLNEEEYQRLMTVMEQFFWALDLPPKRTDKKAPLRGLFYCWETSSSTWHTPGMARPCWEEVGDISAPVAQNRMRLSSPRSMRRSRWPQSTEAEHPQPEAPAWTSWRSRS